MRTRGQGRFVAGFLAAPLGLYLVFVIAPYAQAFYLSLTQWRGFSPPIWVGLDNYRAMLDDANIGRALEHHALLLVVFPTVVLVLGLVFAYWLNIRTGAHGVRRTGVPLATFYRLVFFFPQLLAVPIVAVLFQTIYRPNESGLVNGLLHALGLGPVGFLIEPDLAMWSIVAVLVWQAVGFYVVLFAAALADVPDEILEAAQLDGAGSFVLLFRVTIPMIGEVVKTSWIFLGIAAFDAFAIVNVLSVGNGGPDGATTVLAVEIYTNAFTYSRYGYASAIGVVLFVITLAFTAVVLRISRRGAR